MTQPQNNTVETYSKREDANTDGSLSQALVYIINGPNGKEALDTIKIVAVSITALLGFGLLLGYAPSFHFGSTGIALAKA